jgi:regulator of protease activity HflC (stomatin/prohibitin superfamily)
MIVSKIAGLGALSIAGLVIVFALLIGGVAGCKEFGRYQYRQDAENNLKRAEFEKKIKVEEARATRDSAGLLAEAEIERSKGVAQANKIIAHSITAEYLRYFYIQQLSEVEHLGGKIIYVPTEAGLPILEAERLSQP